MKPHREAGYGKVVLVPRDRINLTLITRELAFMNGDLDRIVEEFRVSAAGPAVTLLIVAAAG